MVENEPLIRSLGAKPPVTHHQKIRALQDADRTRGDRDRVIFAADLVADYLAVSWADKLLPSSNSSLADTNTHTHTLPGTSRSQTEVRHAVNLTSGLFCKGLVD